jgi:hypothetical protein
LESRQRSLRLRVFNTLVVALTYCVRNAGPLFVLVWFPCALSSACLTGLEWLVYGFPPRMPQWLIFNQFHPPTWLTPVVTAPFTAMAWAFVLSHICDRNADRGIVTVSGVRIDAIRFELSSAVLIGASILVATDLLDGLFQFAQLRLFVIVHPLFEWGDAGTEAWAWSAVVFLVRCRLAAVGDECGGGMDLPDHGTGVADRDVRCRSPSQPHAR